MRMTIKDARTYAQELANRSYHPVIVYKCVYTALVTEVCFGVAFKLPLWGEPVGEHVYPEEI